MAEPTESTSNGSNPEKPVSTQQNNNSDAQKNGDDPQSRNDQDSSDSSEENAEEVHSASDEDNGEATTQQNTNSDTQKSEDDNDQDSSASSSSSASGYGEGVLTQERCAELLELPVDAVVEILEDVIRRHQDFERAAAINTLMRNAYGVEWIAKAGYLLR